MAALVSDTENAVFSIDIGTCARTTAQALVEARLQRRQSDTPEAPISFMARASVLFGRGNSDTATLAQLVDRRTNLNALKKTGVFAEDLVQSGSDMTYKRLLNAYSMEELVQYGFNWRLFKALGLDVDDLKNFAPKHFRLLNVTADDIIRDLPITGADLIQLQMGPHVLRELRFKFSHFVDIGMTKPELDALMSEKDLNMYFAPTRAQINQLRQSPEEQYAQTAAQKQSSHRFAPSQRPPRPNPSQTVLHSGKLNF